LGSAQSIEPAFNRGSYGIATEPFDEIQVEYGIPQLDVRSCMRKLA
jgi:hypothetical protein